MKTGAFERGKKKKKGEQEDMKLFPISARVWKFNFTAHEQYQTNTPAERAPSRLSDAAAKARTGKASGVGEGQANG